MVTFIIPFGPFRDIDASGPSNPFRATMLLILTVHSGILLVPLRSLWSFQGYFWSLHLFQGYLWSLQSFQGYLWSIQSFHGYFWSLHLLIGYFWSLQSYGPFSPFRDTSNPSICFQDTSGPFSPFRDTSGPSGTFRGTSGPSSSFSNPVRSPCTSFSYSPFIPLIILIKCITDNVPGQSFQKSYLILFYLNSLWEIILTYIL